jgi:hypothetical protein
MPDLPNFFILGAAKAGTTALCDLLRQHPQVYVTFSKEPMFFSRDEFFANGLDWYRHTYFSDSAAYDLRGDATPHYLYWAEKVAPRLARTFEPDSVKLILIFREPAQRAYSWYWNMVREGKETLPFAEALAAEPRNLKEHWEQLHALGAMTYGYFRGGCYATQLQYYLDLFPRANFYFLLQEDLKNDFAAAMRGLFRFLGVDESVTVQPVVSNPSAMPRNRSVHQLLHGPSRLKEWFKRLVPFSLRFRLKTSLADANLRSFEYPPLDPQLAANLRLRYADEVNRLASMIGRDLSHWQAAN